MRNVAGLAQSARLAERERVQRIAQVGQAARGALRRQISRSIGPLRAVAQQNHAGQAFAGFAPQHVLECRADRRLLPVRAVGPSRACPCEKSSGCNSASKRRQLDLEVLAKLLQRGQRFVERRCEQLPSAVLPPTASAIIMLRERSASTTSVAALCFVVRVHERRPQHGEHRQHDHAPAADPSSVAPSARREPMARQPKQGRAAAPAPAQWR